MKDMQEMPLNQLVFEEIGCAMVDSCPPYFSQEELFEVFMTNFYRHYNSNRAPLGKYIIKCYENPSNHNPSNFRFTKFNDPSNFWFIEFNDPANFKIDEFLVSKWELLGIGEGETCPTGLGRGKHALGCWLGQVKLGWQLFLANREFGIKGDLTE